MPVFRASVGGAAPLRIQLTAPAGLSLRVLGFAAEGLNTNGTASRPIMFVPSTAGSGTGTALPSDGHSISQAVVVTNFSIPSSNPSVTASVANLPIQIRRRWDRVQAPIVPPGGSIVLYAAASGGHNWSGEIEWEEGEQ